MSSGFLRRRMKAAITLVIAVLFVACQLASGPAHASPSSTNDGAPAAVTSLDDHRRMVGEDFGLAGDNAHGHAHSKAPGPGSAPHCDAVCHGLLAVGRPSVGARTVVIARLSPPGETDAPTTTPDRIDRPPSPTTVN